MAAKRGSPTVNAWDAIGLVVVYLFWCGMTLATIEVVMMGAVAIRTEDPLFLELGLWPGLIVMHLSPGIGYLVFRQLRVRRAPRRMWLWRLLEIAVFVLTWFAGLTLCAIAHSLAGHLSFL